MLGGINMKMNRYEENPLGELLILEAEEGVAIDCFREGKIYLRAVKQNIYSENYKNPPIPEGYKHILGEWNNGFVIERCTDGSQFVWVPVGSLKPNGILNQETFTEKFGRRNYMDAREKDEFININEVKKIYKILGNYNFLKYFFEPLTDEFVAQIESVKKYGGFYISRYDVSLNQYGELQSVKDEIPFIIDENVAAYDPDRGIFNPIIDIEIPKLISNFEKGTNVKAHLTYGSEIDSAIEWFVETGVKTIDDISSSDPYCTNEIKLLKTGEISCEYDEEYGKILS